MIVCNLGVNTFGPFVKAGVGEYKYILATIDYFPKWSRAILVYDFTTLTILKFIRIYIIYKFGILDTIMGDNGQPFKSATQC